MKKILKKGQMNVVLDAYNKLANLYGAYGQKDGYEETCENLRAAMLSLEDILKDNLY